MQGSFVCWPSGTGRSPALGSARGPPTDGRICRTMDAYPMACPQNPMRISCSTRKLAAIVAVAAVAASGMTFAQTMPDRSMGPDQHQMTQSGPHPMDPGQMKEVMRQHQGMMRAHTGMDA